ncbi:hypothetical protein [Natronospira bacteriovora]|uniref:Uncharacterized protein n=1 Tax=Natronospira bacteriovora TaxID=3069753 RepID=A0ABU0W5I7_9GAMM|nr:hypothetical protein [Natronospira sp. AB-CW4]MDQ2069227.1 hypothetical protein [Natronospira sp. AB-CW4]
MRFGSFKPLFALTALVLLLSACAGGSPIQHHEGKTVYTQITIWADGNQHLATNYRVGYQIPVNTRVEILDSNRDAIVINVPDINRNVRIVNVPGYTNLDIEGIYDRYFSDSRVNLNRFDAATREAIEKGEPKEGMSRDAVVMARGYPPAHQTPSLDQNTWTYWRNRFARQVVTFSGDSVSELEGF